MPATTVAALPVALVGFDRRTAPHDERVGGSGARLDPLLAAAAAGGAGPLPVGLGRAVVAHATLARDTARRVAAVGTALAVAGGPAGVLTLALGARREPLAPAVAAALLRALGPDGDPEATAWLADALGAGTVAAVARTHPELVGPADGMPVEARYAANRLLATRAAEEAAAAGDASLASALAALAAPDRQILLLDPARGHVAEVFGDLRTAEGVSVVVPGMANRLADFDQVAGKAQALRAAATALDPPADVATVAWLGYDSPFADVLLDDAARAAASSLVRAVEALPARPGATVSVVGHSYGSVVAGAALAAGLDVDAVAVTGSPGMLADRAADLGEVPLYAVRAPGDAIAWSEHFGPDPSGPDFGATRLDAGGVAGHAGYFDPGTAALTNLALVAAGRAGEATVDGTGVLETAVDAIDDLHELFVAAPMDLAQAGARAVAGGASSLTDRAEHLLPGPAAAAVDGLQHAAGAAFELGDRSVDLVQRLSSPDLAGDVVGDLLDWALR